MQQEDPGPRGSVSPSISPSANITRPGAGHKNGIRPLSPAGFNPAECLRPAGRWRSAGAEEDVGSGRVQASRSVSV